MTIARLYRLEAAEGKAAELEAALTVLAGRVRQLSGCRGVEVLRVSDNSSLFTLIEKWDSIEAHKSGAKALGKEAAAAMVAALAGAPQGSYLEYVLTN